MAGVWLGPPPQVGWAEGRRPDLIQHPRGPGMTIPSRHTNEEAKHERGDIPGHQGAYLLEPLCGF